MIHPADFKYRAFLSYSHADTPLAKGLHARLESFPLRGLSGRETALGPVPKSLRPIFRETLNDQSMAALDAFARSSCCARRGEQITLAAPGDVYIFITLYT